MTAAETETEARAIREAVTAAEARATREAVTEADRRVRAIRGIVMEAEARVTREAVTEADLRARADLQAAAAAQAVRDREIPLPRALTPRCRQSLPATVRTRIITRTINTIRRTSTRTDQEARAARYPSIRLSCRRSR